MKESLFQNELNRYTLSSARFAVIECWRKRALRGWGRRVDQLGTAVSPSASLAIETLARAVSSVFLVWFGFGFGLNLDFLFLHSRDDYYFGMILDVPTT